MTVRTCDVKYVHKSMCVHNKIENGIIHLCTCASMSSDAFRIFLRGGWENWVSECVWVWVCVGGGGRGRGPSC